MKTFLVLLLTGLAAVVNADMLPTTTNSTDERALRTGDEHEIDAVEALRILEPAVTRVTPEQVSSVVVSSIEIGKAVAVAAGADQKSKSCHQLACWIASPSYDCSFAATNQVQRDLTRSRNSFRVDSSNSQGMWVRYWRTEFTPPDRGNIAKGSFSNHQKHTVTNCQPTGKVYC
jgi:hypothetical protein